MLGVSFGADMYEIFLAAYDSINGNTVLSRILNTGIIKWSYSCSLRYDEAPLLLNVLI